jgi:ParB family transcriptional regulator, chromosome partitioning protein
LPKSLSIASRSLTAARAVDPDAVVRLTNSIAVVGLQHPITVAKRDGGYRLLAGAHRVTAFRELGMERISANIVELDDLRAELVELDENLARNELSPAERSAAVARRNAIYEKLHPETKHGAVGKGREPPKGSAKADRFSAATAAATGRSERAIQLDAHRGEVLGGETLAKVAGTSLDRGTELDALAKLPADERQVLVDRAAAGEVVTAQALSKPSVVQPDPAAADELAEFLGRAEGATKAAFYSGGLLYDEIIDATRTVIRTWQKFLIEMEREFAELDEPVA